MKPGDAADESATREAGHRDGEGGFGEPVEKDGVTVVPVARVRFGLGGGGRGPGRKKKGGEDGDAEQVGYGHGGGVQAGPLGFIELSGGKASYRRIADPVRPMAVALLAPLVGALCSGSPRSSGCGSGRCVDVAGARCDCRGFPMCRIGNTRPSQEVGGTIRASRTRSHRGEARRGHRASRRRDRPGDTHLIQEEDHHDFDPKDLPTAGVFYLLTFVSIPILFLYSAVRGATTFVGGATPASTSAASWRSSWRSPASAPPSRSTRWSSGRTKGSRSASSPPDGKAGAIFASVFVLLAIVSLRQAGAGAARSSPPDAGRPARLDVHPQPEPPSGRERPPDRLPALPVAPGAADPSRAGIHRSGPARHFHHGHPVRRQRVRFRDVGAPGTPDRGWGSRWASTSSSRDSGRLVCGSSALSR